MASIAFPQLAKKATLSDGTTYGYVCVPSDQPTFLLLHGYPSTCYDWRHQIASLQAAGYGVIAPDLLGYGDTDKPTDVARYRSKTMSAHMVEILDRENVSRAIAVAHDWGVGLGSRLATYHPDRFYGLVTLAVSYLQPGFDWDIPAICSFAKDLVGYETHAYWLWHNTEEAAREYDKHPASTFNLLYPHDPTLWKTDFAPPGKAAEFVRAGRTTPLPSWYPLDEYTVRDRSFAASGHAGGLCWYQGAMRGVDAADEAAVADEDKPLRMPNLFVAATQDYVCRADMQTALAKQWVPDGKVVTLECGHWVQLEEPEVVHRLLVEFAAEVVQ